MLQAHKEAVSHTADICMLILENLGDSLLMWKIIAESTDSVEHGNYFLNVTCNSFQKLILSYCEKCTFNQRLGLLTVGAFRILLMHNVLFNYHNFSQQGNLNPGLLAC